MSGIFQIGSGGVRLPNFVPIIFTQEVHVFDANSIG